MKKPVIKEVIIVEGKHDAQKLESCVDADILITHGTHVSKDFLKTCKRLNETRGILVFTDPDGPGEQIRRKIIEYVGTCRHASLNTIQARKGQKVGIEHASVEDILESLAHSATYDTHQESITWDQYVELGLMGNRESQGFRDKLSESFYLPVGNAKKIFKYLNMMGITKEMCERVLRGV